MTSDPLTQCLALLQEIFPHPPMTPARLAAFRLALADLTATECDLAFRTLAADPERTFFPAPGEIREAGRPGLTAAECVAMFERIEGRVIARRRYGYPEIEADFGTPARLAIQAAGGLEACWGGDGRVFALKRFVEAYREEAATPREVIGSVDDRLAHLVSSTSNVLAFPPRGKAS